MDDYFTEELTEKYKYLSPLSQTVANTNVAHHWHICRTCHNTVHEDTPEDRMVLDTQRTELTRRTPGPTPAEM